MTYEKLIAAYDELASAIKAQCSRLPFDVGFEAPDFATKRQIVMLADSLGLQDDGHGTWRAWAEYPEGSKLRSLYFESMGTEVYLHTVHCRVQPRDYRGADDVRNMLTLGYYQCSPRRTLPAMPGWL